MTKDLVEKFKNIATTATAGVISLAPISAFSQASTKAEANTHLAAFNAPAQIDQTELSPEIQAMRHARETQAGVTAFVSIGQQYANTLQAKGLDYDTLGRAIKQKYESEYGIETAIGFWELSDRNATFVTFYMGPNCFFDPITEKTSHSFQDALTMGAQVRQALEITERPLASKDTSSPENTVTASL